MSGERRIGKVRLSLALLEELLALPQGHHIHYVCMDSGDDVVNGIATVVVAGPTLPAVPEGCVLPVVNMVVHPRRAEFT